MTETIRLTEEALHLIRKAFILLSDIDKRKIPATAKVNLREILEFSISITNTINDLLFYVSEINDETGDSNVEQSVS